MPEKEIGFSMKHAYSLFLFFILLTFTPNIWSATTSIQKMPSSHPKWVNEAKTPTIVKRKLVTQAIFTKWGNNDSPVAGAEVTISGVVMGKTNDKGRLSATTLAGYHDLKATRPGFAGYVGKKYFDGSSTIKIDLLKLNDMAPITGCLVTNINCGSTIGAHDVDNDGVLSPADNCPWQYNPDQKDTDKNCIGDVCENYNILTGNMTGLQHPPKSLSISGDGRFVAFSIFPNATSGFTQVFVRDLKLGTTLLVSRSSNGEEGNSASFDAAISTNGRYVTFASYANNLVPNDNNNKSDIFSRDLNTGTTTLVSVSTEGGPADGEPYNYQEASLILSEMPSISADGRYIAFKSSANNLVADGNQKPISEGYPFMRISDIFLRDTALGTTKRVGIDSNGNPLPGVSFSPSVDMNGNRVAFVNYWTVTDGQYKGMQIYQIRLRDIVKNETRLISSTASGEPADFDSSNPKISMDGTKVVFQSLATNLSYPDYFILDDIFLKDIGINGVEWISSIAPMYAGLQPLGVGVDHFHGNVMSPDSSENPSIDATNCHIAFESGVKRLIDEDTNDERDIFIRNRDDSTTELISRSYTGGQSNGYSAHPAISADGRYVVFTSKATNLTPNIKDPKLFDIFVYDLMKKLTIPVTVK